MQHYLNNNVINGEEQQLHIFHTRFYGFEFSYDRVNTFTSHWDAENLLWDTLIPIYLYRHYILIIMQPSSRFIFVLDPLRGRHSKITNKLCIWYAEVWHHVVTNADNLWPNAEWKIVWGNELNVRNIPTQHDSVNFGVYVCMYAYYYIIYNKFPNKNNDFNHSVVNKLRLWIAYYINSSISKLIENKDWMNSTFYYIQKMMQQENIPAQGPLHPIDNFII